MASWWVSWPLRSSGYRARATDQASASSERAMTPMRMPFDAMFAGNASAYSAGGLGYSTAVAFSCRAASIPASEDPETSTPGINSAGSGGVSLRLVTL